MLPLFIVEQIPEMGEISIGGDEARHAISAMRLEISERVEVTDGKGRRALVEVRAKSKRELTVGIIKVDSVPKPKTKLIVVQALTKGDRARETVELLTEGGVSEIVPWQSSRSIGNWRGEKDSLGKWRLWAREATKQSRRSWIPEVMQLQSTEQVCALINTCKVTFLFHEAGGVPISQSISGSAPSEVILIIGPEGGINPDEAEAFSRAGALTVAMGEPILRSAHAGLAALAAVQTGYGIW